MNRNELKSKTPHGYGKKIAARAGVTEKAVSLFFNNKINSHRIEMATLEVLSEIGQSKNILIANII